MGDGALERQLQQLPPSVFLIFRFQLPPSVFLIFRFQPLCVSDFVNPTCSGAPWLAYLFQVWTSGGSTLAPRKPCYIGLDIYQRKTSSAFGFRFCGPQGAQSWRRARPPSSSAENFQGRWLVLTWVVAKSTGSCKGVDLFLQKSWLVLAKELTGSYQGVDWFLQRNCYQVDWFLQAVLTKKLTGFDKGVVAQEPNEQIFDKNTVDSSLVLQKTKQVRNPKPENP